MKVEILNLLTKNEMEEVAAVNYRCVQGILGRLLCIRRRSCADHSHG